MNEIVKVFNGEFEGSSFTTITYKGRPCWIAKDIGKALGYSDNGRGFVTMISRDWKEEFIDGKDHVVLRGKELSEFKSLLEVSEDYSLSRTPNLTLLFETGMHMALVKVNKPVGRKLRRLIVDEVLPQIARDGAYLPERKVVEGEIIDREIDEPEEKKESVPSLAERKLAVSEARERRLQGQAQSNAIKEIAGLLKRHGRPDSVVLSCEIIAAERATGIDFGMLKPAIEKEAGWVTAGDIGRQLGRSAQFIASRIRKLGYGDGTVYCRPVMGLKNITILGSKVIDIKYYDPKIVPAINAACIEYDKFRGIDEDQKVIVFPSKDDGLTK